MVPARGALPLGLGGPQVDGGQEAGRHPLIGPGRRQHAGGVGAQAAQVLRGDEGAAAQRLHDPVAVGGHAVADEHQPPVRAQFFDKGLQRQGVGGDDLRRQAVFHVVGGAVHLAAAGVQYRAAQPVEAVEVHRERLQRVDACAGSADGVGQALHGAHADAHAGKGAGARHRREHVDIAAVKPGGRQRLIHRGHDGLGVGQAPVHRDLVRHLTVGHHRAARHRPGGVDREYVHASDLHSDSAPGSKPTTP